MSLPFRPHRDPKSYVEPSRYAVEYKPDKLYLIPSFMSWNIVGYEGGIEPNAIGWTQSCWPEHEDARKMLAFLALDFDVQELTLEEFHKILGSRPKPAVGQDDDEIPF